METVVSVSKYERSIIQVTLTTKRCRFPTVFWARFPLGKYASVRAAAGVAKATGKHAYQRARAEPGQQSSTNCGAARLSRKASFRSFGCAETYFTDKNVTIKPSMLQRTPFNAFSGQLSK